MTEHHITVSRTARYFVLGPAAADAMEVWFVLHGYGQLAGRFLRHFAPLDDGTRCFVAPEGLSRFYVEAGRNDKIGASWMTREDRLAEIDDYVRYLDLLHTVVLQRRSGPCPVTVLGFSQGTATASRWLARGSVRADRLILWGGEVPPDLDLAAARDRWATTVLTLVVGSSDRFITAKVLASDEQRLSEHGIAYRVVAFEGGHDLESAVLKRVANPDIAR